MMFFDFENKFKKNQQYVLSVLSAIIFKEKVPDGPRQRQPDIALAKKLLGWELKTTRRAGLLKTMNYIKETIAYPLLQQK